MLRTLFYAASAMLASGAAAVQGAPLFHAANAVLASGAAAVQVVPPFRTVGKKVYDSQNSQIVFKGIGFSCTEYMMRPMFPEPDPHNISGGDWPGKFAWQNCFVGSPGPNQTFALNNETGYVLNYLRPDYKGGNFLTKPTIQKVSMGDVYNEVVDLQAQPLSVPIVRIPLTASSYLYDGDCNKVGSAGYRAMIDLLVQNLTSNGIAVILDHHDSCAQWDCQRSGPMALRNFTNYTGSLAFWDKVASTYASNPWVLYELYNEPHVWYQAFYGGDPLYAGMSEMYDVVRNHTKDGLVVIAGMQQYAQDAAGSLAFYMQYTREHNNTAPFNVLYNLHPYQGVYQGLEHSIRSTLRLTLALQTIGPVIWTELGQYCCNAGNYTTCQKTGPCKDHAHADWFVYNVLNEATQFDVSWVGWAWRGTGSPSDNCTQVCIRDCLCGPR
jgi:aryl-phospho-beta-D-glucosidase BglC (GH1 family)